RWPASGGFLAHHERVVDFRIWLAEACAAGGFSCEFLPSRDPRADRSLAIALNTTGRVLIPDGALTLTSPQGRRALFLLEVDRGTEPLRGPHESAIARKFAAYASAYDAGAEEQYREHFGEGWSGFRILCLVPSLARREAFLRLASEHDLAPLVWVALLELTSAPGDLFARSWALRLAGPLHALGE